MSPEDVVYLNHILRAARTIQDFIAGYDSRIFAHDLKTQSAVNWQLAVIGEGTKLISDEFRESHPEIPWSEMARTRDRLIHGYMSIKAGRVWDTAVNDIPALIAQLEPLVPPEDE